MNTTFENKVKESIENKYINYGVTGKVLELSLNGFTSATMRNKNTLEVMFDDATFTVEYPNLDEVGVAVIENAGVEGSDHKFGTSFIVNIGLATKSNYLSTKKIPVDFDYMNGNLTEIQVIELLKFETDAQKNSFDPFYAENEAKRRNAAGWNYVAQNFITDPYCTK